MEKTGKVVAARECKAWKPSTNTSSLVLTIPPHDDIKEGDKFLVTVNDDRTIIATPV